MLDDGRSGEGVAVQQSARGALDRFASCSYCTMQSLAFVIRGLNLGRPSTGENRSSRADCERMVWGKFARARDLLIHFLA